VEIAQVLISLPLSKMSILYTGGGGAVQAAICSTVAFQNGFVIAGDFLDFSE
jgi:hypothetical protein